ncbi:MAG: hypothetical protein KDE30_13135 [Novosphingobium sp.]|nr:hypothetical protein [Novosphingobium sp.]
MVGISHKKKEDMKDIKTTEISLLYDEKERLENGGVLVWKNHFDLNIPLPAKEYDDVLKYMEVVNEIKRLER